MAGKKILITGANGFIGKNLITGLFTTDYEIIPVVRKSIGFKNEVILDFCNSNFYKTIHSLQKVDAVIHLGAKVDLVGSSKKELFVPNVLATAELAEWAYKTGAYFVFASTAICSGIRNPHITYESEANPDTAYGYSKWLSEEIIRMSGVKHSILRIGGVFGKDGPYHLGINRSIDNALKGLRSVQYGNGRSKRNYIYVKDLSKVIVYCLENKIEGTHLVGGSTINTISEMLKMIHDVLLPGNEPEYQEGVNGYDQLVEHSEYLPEGISFKEAIEDIKDNYYAE